MKPGDWPAGLLPISLLAFVAALVPLIIKRRLVLIQRQKSKAKLQEVETGEAGNGDSD